MTNYNILIAGFGGQGIQFAGKLLTYIGMYTGLEVSLYPSYGPEMRGGTSNCGVNISTDPFFEAGHGENIVARNLILMKE